MSENDGISNIRSTRH